MLVLCDRYRNDLRIHYIIFILLYNFDFYLILMFTIFILHYAHINLISKLIIYLLFLIFLNNNFCLHNFWRKGKLNSALEAFEKNAFFFYRK